MGGGELLGKLYTCAMASRDASPADSAMIMSVIVTIIKSAGVRIRNTSVRIRNTRVQIRNTSCHALLFDQQFCFIIIYNVRMNFTTQPSRNIQVRGLSLSKP